MNELSPNATLGQQEYRVAFDETGGYDCMTGAFRIFSPAGTVVDVDLRHYGQKPCDYEGSGFVDAKERAEAMAHRICAALNSHTSPTTAPTTDYQDAIRYRWLRVTTPVRSDCGGHFLDFDNWIPAPKPWLSAEDADKNFDKAIDDAIVGWMGEPK